MIMITPVPSFAIRGAAGEDVHYRKLHERSEFVLSPHFPHLTVRTVHISPRTKPIEPDTFIQRVVQQSAPDQALRLGTLQREL